MRHFLVSTKARFRDRSKAVARLRLLLGVAILVVGVLAWFALPALIYPDYFSFRHRGNKYYAEFASACAALMSEHPPGTNTYLEIAPTDPSVPKILKGVNPLKIKITTDRVWILHGGSLEFGIACRQQLFDTNAWILSTTCES